MNHDIGDDTMTQTDEPKTVLRRYVAALQAGDEPAIRTAFADDATWTLHAGDLPISGTWRGRDAIIDEFLGSALRLYEPGSIAIEVTALIAEGDRVALQWTTRARTRDGSPYENGCIGIFTVRDGRIQTVREYMDTLYARDVAFATARARS
jgi:ketosteroid isomerase-like protein